MSEWIKVLLSLSFSGTLLMLFLFFCKRLYRKKFSKSFQYYIWLLVALRFLLPFSPEVTLTGVLFRGMDIAGVEGSFEKNEGKEQETADYGSKGQKADTAEGLVIAEDAAEQKVIEEARQSAGPEAAGEAGRVKGQFLFPCLFWLWLIAAAALLVRKILVYHRFLWELKQENQKVQEPAILNILPECKERTKVKREVGLYQNPLITSPIMTGFFHPAIFIPEGDFPKEYSTERLAFIFTHELLHYKRYDMFYKWFIQMVICIHWFNPFVYVLGKEINRACELSCDEAVIDLFGEGAKRVYGDTLLSFIQINARTRGKNSFAAMTLTEGAKQIKERLGDIMEHRKKSKSMKAGMAVFTIVVCVLFGVFGAYAVPVSAQEKASEMMNKSAQTALRGIMEAQFDKHLKEVLENNKKKTERLKEMEEEQENFGVPYEGGRIYSYYQQGYYWDSYIIELGWNMDKHAPASYSHQIEITLPDQSTMQVYVADEIGENLEPGEISAIVSLIVHLNEEEKKGIQMPWVRRISYVEEKEIPNAAREYYQAEDYMGFTLLFPALDAETKEDYYQQIYDEDRVDFFNLTAEYMAKEDYRIYLEKAWEDDRVSFFASLLSQMQLGKGEALGDYADLEKYYEDDDITWFCISADHMTDEERTVWLDRAKKDGNETFYYVLKDRM